MFVENSFNKTEYEFSPNAIAILAGLSANYSIELIICDYKFCSEDSGKIAVQELLELNCVTDLVTLLPDLTAIDVADKLMSMEQSEAVSPTTLFEFIAEEAILQFDLVTEPNVLILSNHQHTSKFETKHKDKLILMDGILTSEVFSEIITKIST